MKQIATGLLALSLFAGGFCNDTVQAAKYKIDESHSQAVFKVKHLGISTVTGQFNDLSGIIEFEDFFQKPEKAKSAKTSAQIVVASLNTGIPKRDEHLKGKDFFDTTEYPTIKFNSKVVEPTGENKFNLIGDLTMHGVTKPVILNAVYEGKEKDPFSGKEKIAFTATTKLNRKDYGLVWNKLLESGNIAVGEEVSITLEVEADKE
jgi:polyisoprenoid-binding protein YceI